MDKRRGRRPIGDRKRLRRGITPSPEAWACAMALSGTRGHNSVSRLFDELVMAEWARLRSSLMEKVGVPPVPD